MFPHANFPVVNLARHHLFLRRYRGRWNSTMVAIVCMRRGGVVADARWLQLLSNHPNLVQFYRCAGSCVRARVKICVCVCIRVSLPALPADACIKNSVHKFILLTQAFSPSRGGLAMLQRFKTEREKSYHSTAISCCSIY